MQLLDASEPMDGVWCGGLEGEGEKGVDIFFDNGAVQLGVHNGERGALITLTQEQATWIAKLLIRAAAPAASEDGAL